MMYGMTPFARNAFSIFNALDDFDKDFFSGTMPMNTCRTDIRDAGDKYIMESDTTDTMQLVENIVNGERYNGILA